MIPYGRQNINQNDIDAVVEVLESDFITQGPQVPAFEKAICNASTAQYAVAVNSATSALHIACQALGLKPGDWLWTSPITFVASANCGRYCGANVDFVDIDPLTYTLCPDALEKKLIEAKNSNQLPKVVIPVHLAGHSCDMQAIHDLSNQYGFSIIEDASHGIGARYQDHAVGSCLYSDITVFSFHPVKIITSGEGGAAATNDASLAEKMSLYRSHGITRNPELMKNPSDAPWYYEQIDLGQNYRLTDIQAALGLSQLKRLNQFVNKRRELVQSYRVLLEGLPITLPTEYKEVYSSYHLYIIRLHLCSINNSQREVFEQLIKAGVGVNLHYIPVYKHPYYQALSNQDVDAKRVHSEVSCSQKCIGSDNHYPNAEAYYQEAISLPLFPDLTERDQVYIASTLKKILKVE